ncbi:MAG: metallophosphoesterase family protein [Chroococcales cyanobacterium]
MNLSFRFAVLSDPHIALPHTIWDHPSRFHLVEVSIPALEIVFHHLESLPLDFLLIPGDLTQHGEAENHSWLQKRLDALPFPVYVVPGNHDVPYFQATEKSIGLKDFPHYYPSCGYNNPHQLYYSHEILPGVQLIGLNSNQFNLEGKQLGYLDEEQFTWLEKVLSQEKDKFRMVMIHHNVVEHLPNQAQHELGQRYMLENAPRLRQLLRSHQVKLVFSGHLHVQDIAYDQGLYDITTGSLVSYPHPYRILQLNTNANGQYQLKIESHRIESVPGWDNLSEKSREWMSDRSYPFMVKLLTSPPLNLPLHEASEIAPQLRFFWADIAAGDAIFNFSHFPPAVRHYLETFNATHSPLEHQLIDNQASLTL